jgi:dipeptidyl aminopeptidase/acylaminoacyl peptidase
VRRARRLAWPGQADGSGTGREGAFVQSPSRLSLRSGTPGESWTDSVGRCGENLGLVLSPDRRLVADEPSVPCCGGGQRPGGVIFVARADGSRRHEVARGHLAGWTPDGRVVFSTGQLFEFRTGDFLALDLASGKVQLVLSHRKVAEGARVPKAEIGSPVWSADRRYFAARALLTPAGGRRTLWAVVVAGTGGKIIRILRSPYEISMFAWSPTGHRLAYTTSGFPAPHELFVVDSPDAAPRRIFSAGRHFDWITWSPTGRWLLLDDESAGQWRLLDASRGRTQRVLPRLGGRPLWCCPQNEFSGRL